MIAASQERTRDAERKRASRRDARVVVIPPCEDRARRESLEQNDIAWLMYYFGPDSEAEDPFWYEFTSQQVEMIDAIRHAIQHGGDQALAASRGEGKTTLVERLLVKYTLSGVLTYSVLCAATGGMADNSLDAIKSAIEENPLLLADYPEVCVPVQALEGSPQRAGTQVVSGIRHDNGEEYSQHRSKFSWCGQEVILPRVPGSPASGAIIATRGLDAAIRGLKKKGKRPKIVVIDDPDTEDTARSEEQAKKLEDRIEKAIGGLGGQQRSVARVMMTTLQNRICVSYRYTDPQQKPTWNGKRFRYLITPPERVDMWDEYVQLRVTDMQNGDKFGRNAHNFYLENREKMEAGAVVANPNRFDASILPDGSQAELSSLQHYYNEVARLGPEAVATEYDNDPPEEMGIVESGITASRIQMRLSGYPRGIVPPGAVALTQGIDLRKPGAHWVVRAWMSDATNYVIDYGFHESHGTTYGSDEGVERAINRVICERMEVVKENPYMLPDSEVVDIGMTLADSGWMTDAVYRACLTIGLGIYPAKGHGKSTGCASPSFHTINRRSMDRKPGDGWFQSRQRVDGQTVWLVNCDTDRWKSFEHERWLTGDGKPGAAYIFGDMSDDERRHLHQRMPQDAKDHHAFARHITAEIEVEEPIRGVIVRRWKAKPGRVNNHYLDASYLSNVAASMLGVRLLSPMASKKSEPSARPSARDLAARRA